MNRTGLKMFQDSDCPYYINYFVTQERPEYFFNIL